MAFVRSGALATLSASWQAYGWNRTCTPTGTAPRAWLWSHVCDLATIGTERLLVVVRATCHASCDIPVRRLYSLCTLYL